ncbi:MAG: flagellar motor protein MotB [Paracoccaceae bacterium]
MGAQTNVAPIIIKKKKSSGGDGHHGGAWKVAYADFVTAMMAFFMLMWLLNATTEKQRKGIADYFSPTIPIHRISGGGNGYYAGDSLQSEEILPRMGSGATNTNPVDADRSRGDSGLSIDGGPHDGQPDDLATVESAFRSHSGESAVEDELLRHVVTKVTDEGLIIELFALEGRPLFEPNSDKPTPILRDLARLVVHAAALVTNDIAVGGHVRAYPAPLAENPVWTLSAARADSLRRVLETVGEDPERFRRVVGHADNHLATTDPLDERNNRMEVILLRH